MCPSGLTGDEVLSHALSQLRSVVGELERAQDEVQKELGKLINTSQPRPTPVSQANPSAVEEEKKVVGLFHPSQHEFSIAGTRRC